MDLFQAAVLGAVQGLTEFIPISSSAHLILIPWLLGWPDPGLTFDAALHLGTLVALLWFFRDDWWRYSVAGLRTLVIRDASGDGRLAWLIVLGSIPGGVAGLLGDDFVEGAFHQSSAPHGLTAMMAIGLLMIGLGLLLWVAERRAAHRRDLGALRLPDAILVGCAQALAILPGVSRSGATITMGLALGMQRPVAARFSFLLAAPIVAGAGLKKVYDAVKVGLSGHDALILIVGVASAALVGYLCIRFLLRYLQSRTTDVFVYYRFCAGLAIIALAWARG